ncbi:MAG: YfhO family protein [Gemmatimonadaceae bacterium]|nr:YfhO family protein [Gemmatimonadaceae bacterium]
MGASTDPNGVSLFHRLVTDSPPPARDVRSFWAYLLQIVGALTLAAPALAGRFLVNPWSDQYIAGYAFREYAAATLKAAGSFPQWNPYLFGGMPYIAAMHGDIFYPTFLLRMILPTDVAMTWGMILHLMLAGICTVAFLRAQGLGMAAAAVGGIAYMMSGQVASLVSPGHDGKLFISALLPLTLLVLTYGMRDGKRWAWGVLSLVIGLGVLTPHPQLFQYLLLASGGWALVLAFAPLDGTPLPRTVAVQRLGWALGAVLLGGLIGAVQFAPVREYVAWSPRAGGRDYEYATSFSMPPEELISAWIPQFSGILEAYWGRNPLKLHSEYLGVVTLLLAGLAFGSTTEVRQRGLRRFAIGVGVISLFWALGGYTPFYQLVYAIVPGAKFFRAPSTIYFVTTFAVALLAALGVQRVADGRVSMRAVMVWGGVGTLSAVLALTGALGNLAASVAIPQRLDAVDANRAALAFGGWRVLAFAALATFTLWQTVTARLPRHAVVWAFALFMIGDSWTVERRYWQFSEPAARIYGDDDITRYLAKQDAPGRVIAAPIAGTGVPHDPFLSGDAFMSHRVRTVLGYHGNEIGRYQRLGNKDAGWSQIANPAFWQLANARWFYTDSDSLPIPGATRVVGPIQNAAGSRVSLFQLPGANPLAWVAPQMARYPDDAVAQAVMAPNFPTYSLALFDTSAKIDAGPAAAIPAPLALQVTTTAYAPGAISLALSAPAPAGSALVVSENYFPGWTATVDGKVTAIDRVNLSLIGVPLPAGAQRVELRFADPAYATGKVITLVALAAAMLLAIAGVVTERRRGAHA